MADFVDGIPSPVFAINRAEFSTRAGLVASIKFHLAIGGIVQVEDSTRPRFRPLCYEVRPIEVAFHLFNARGRQIGVFADITALVDYAEAVTGT